MLKLGRPIFMPEIPYVSGFRPWQGPNCVLPPAVVCSTLQAMLATHGYLRGTFAGHSYGTSWLSYMCKYAPSAVSALLFLDPICFCLHVSRLTKKFIYHQPDPGCIRYVLECIWFGLLCFVVVSFLTCIFSSRFASYVVRTDLIVHWTIQRSFPWAWIILFAEQIHVPCSVFLSDQDALVPAQKVEEYLRSKGLPVVDFQPGMNIKEELFAQTHNPPPKGEPAAGSDVCADSSMSSTVAGGDCGETSTGIDYDERPKMINVCIFRGHGHGDWTDYPMHTVPVIADCMKELCGQAEARRRQ